MKLMAVIAVMLVATVFAACLTPLVLHFTGGMP